MTVAAFKPRIVATPRIQPRAYVQLYHHGETNRCPACSGRHWLVGRITAQCAFCETAIALAGGVS